MPEEWGACEVEKVGEYKTSVLEGDFDDIWFKSKETLCGDSDETSSASKDETYI